MQLSGVTGAVIHATATTTDFLFQAIVFQLKFANPSWAGRPVSHCVKRSPSAGLVGGSVWDRLYLHLYSLAFTRRVCILLTPTRLSRRANGSSSSRRCLWQSAQACHGPRSCVYTRAPGHNKLALNQTNSNWGLFRFGKPCQSPSPYATTAHTHVGLCLYDHSLEFRHATCSNLLLNLF